MYLEISAQKKCSKFFIDYQDQSLEEQNPPAESKLEYLVLKSSNISPKDLAYLLYIIKNISTIKMLDFEDNNLDDIAIKYFMYYFSFRKTPL